MLCIILSLDIIYKKPIILGVFQAVGDVILNMIVLIDLMKWDVYHEIVQNMNLGIFKILKVVQWCIYFKITMTIYVYVCMYF